MQTKIISTLILLLLLPCVVHAQESKKIREQKLTAAEIKEAERIFATFKKRLEETNDLRIALRGIPSGNWLNRMVDDDVSEVKEIFQADKALVLKNSEISQKLYLNLLSFFWSANLSKNIVPSGGSEYQIPSKLPAKDRKSLEHFFTGEFKYTNKKELIRATHVYSSAIELLSKELNKLKRKRPREYQKGLSHSNVYSDDDMFVSACDSRCYGLPQGTFIAVKTVGVFVTLLGRVNGKIGLLGIYIFSP
jgi:hypothetical protein